MSKVTIKAATRLEARAIVETLGTHEAERNGFDPMKCGMYRTLCVCCPQYLCDKRKI